MEKRRKQRADKKVVMDNQVMQVARQLENPGVEDVLARPASVKRTLSVAMLNGTRLVPGSAKQLAASAEGVDQVETSMAKAAPPVTSQAAMAVRAKPVSAN